MDKSKKSAENSVDTVDQEFAVEVNGDLGNESEEIDSSINKIAIIRILTESNDSIVFDELKNISLGHLFQTNSYSMDGAIGDTYKRLRINITQAQKSSEDSMIYKVVGKTKVNSNICDFTGQIEIESAAKYDDAKSDEEGPPYEVMGDITGSFEFHEDKEQRETGIFRGTFGIRWNINEDSEIVVGSAWYTYRSDMVNFVGEWIDYKTGKSQPICWGSDIPSCLPSDFNCSDGPDFIPCEKYAKNGWETLRASFDFQNETSRKMAQKAETKKWWE